MWSRGKSSELSTIHCVEKYKISDNTSLTLTVLKEIIAKKNRRYLNDRFDWLTDSVVKENTSLSALMMEI